MLDEYSNAAVAAPLGLADFSQVDRQEPRNEFVNFGASICSFCVNLSPNRVN